MSRSDFYLSLGASIRTHRNYAGFTQERVASSIGVSRASLANMEQGRQAVATHLLVRIAEVLAIAPSDLLPTSTETALARAPADQREWIEGILREDAP